MPAPPLEEEQVRAQIDPDALALDEADRVAAALAGLLHRVAVPLARAAAAFVEIRGWTELGFARQSDYVREYLSRSSRWLRQMAVLGRALAAFPALREALTGDDGGPPLGHVAGAEIATVATEVSIDEWIERARAVPFRTLKEDVRRARAAMPAAAGEQREAARAEQAAAFTEDELGDPVERFPLRLLAPPHVRAAFDEALELHRAVSGGESTVTSFVEALIAEAHAGAMPPDDSPVGIPARARHGENVAMLEARRRGLPPHVTSIAGVVDAHDLLRRAAGLFTRAGRGGFAELDEQLHALLGLEHETRVTLGKILVSLADRGAFRKALGRPFPFCGAGDYGENRLGLSRRTAESLVFLARRLEHFPKLRRRYERGVLPVEKTLLLVRFFGRKQIPAEREHSWVALAEMMTVKRLRDELRAAERARAEGPDGDTPAPLDDDGWWASLQRRLGMSHERVVRLAAGACAASFADWTPFRLRLPYELAMDLAGAIEAARISSPLAQTFADRDVRITPMWVGMLTLLLDYTATHDPPDGKSTRRTRVYERDGYRCAAPCCTSRQNLEEHHVVYRSRGGSDDLANRVTLCRFHHQRGEHGGLMSCRGSAPLGLAFRLGRPRGGRWFRNERRMAPLFNA